MNYPNFFEQHTFGHDVITHLGSLENKKILLFIGRSNTQKNSIPLQMLINELIENEYTLVWLSSKNEFTQYLLSEHRGKYLLKINKLFLNQGHIFRIITKQILKIHFFLKHPNRLDYFLKKFKQKEYSVEDQISRYQKLARFLKNQAIVILSHSAGGRIASSLSNEKNISKIIGFGYPFKHPDKPEEPERTSHLEYIQKPFLIFQGRNDEYGGVDVQIKYKLSPFISLAFINATHDYENLSDAEWADITKQIKLFI